MTGLFYRNLCSYKRIEEYYYIKNVTFIREYEKNWFGLRSEIFQLRDEMEHFPEQ